MACCLPTCAKGSSVPVMVNASCGDFFFLGFLVSPWCLVHMESPSFAGLPVVYKRERERERERGEERERLGSKRLA